MQGIPVSSEKLRNIAESFPDNLLQDLAGNAFGSLVILSLLASTLFSLPWSEVPACEEDLLDQAEAHESNAKAALSALGIIIGDDD